MSNTDKKRTRYLWVILPIAFSIFGGGIAYFALKKKDERLGQICLIIGAVMFVVWLYGGPYFSEFTI